MNHEYIDQFNLIDQYLMGRLPAEESAIFEEHFVACPQCISRLQMTKNFLQDLRGVAVEQAAQQPPRRRAFWFFPQIRLPKPVLWATVSLVVLAITGAVFATIYTQHLRLELRQAENQAAQWQRRYEEERQSAISADRKHQETELQQTEQLQALQAKLKDEEAQRTKMAQAFNWQMNSVSNLSVFWLTAMRGGESTASEAVKQIDLRRSSKIFLLSVFLEGEKQFANYRITISDARGRLVWKSGYLIADQNDTLSLPVHAAFFRPGHFTLLVEGIKKEGGKHPLGYYPFQIIKPR
jgi:hypothetical protein